MSLKSSFAIVLRSLRSQRKITQRDFGDTSRTFLSKLEGGKSSLTLNKLEQVSQRLEVSSLTLLTLTLSLESGKSSAELIDDLRLEIEKLERDGGLADLVNAPTLVASAGHPKCDPDGSLRPA
ncbi:helix-turn-helix domain-containing protein [Pseudomonas putida]|uniref:helix-turn-helix domain-containing protein n=1 Tax=Pseudomonas putida TaxID=303 RepID=UPI001E34152E|nr:helix-turn-helix transcriptional regulator [Pseudomonas putida]MCC9009413.1 helix-turn-helix domain-containing protein [Pseudomonas putida]